jgi:CHAT domain
MRASGDLRKLRSALSRCNRDSAQAAAAGFVRAVAVLPADSAIRESQLQTLSDEVDRIYESGDVRQVDTAIAACRSAVAVLSSDHIAPDGGLHGRILRCLCVAQTARYNRTGAETDLDELINVRRQAVDLVPADDPLRGDLLRMLAAGRLLRFQQLRDVADLEEMIKVGRRAAEAGLDEGRSALLYSNLCFGLHYRYLLRGVARDISDAVEYGRLAVQNAGPDHPFRSGCLANYSAALLRRFELLGHEADLEAGRTSAEQAARNATDPGQVPTALLALATAMRLQAEQTDSPAENEKAVAAAGLALRSAVDQDRAECLSNLALCLERRFELTGDQDALSKAVDLGRQAVNLTKGGDQARYQSNYGSFLLRRYQLVGELADLSAGVGACLAAADAAMLNAPLRARYLGNLSNALAAEYQRTGVADAWDRAMKAARAALQASPDDDANRGSYLNGLAGVLMLRPEDVSGDDLAEAAELSRQAVERAPAGSAQQAVFMAARSLIMLISYAQAKRKPELDEAVNAAQGAVNITSAEHQFRALYLGRLVIALLARAQLKRNTADQAGAASDQEAAARAGREASEITTAPPALRAAAAAGWGNAAAADGDWAEAVHAYQAAIELAAKAAPRALARADQEFQLAQLRGLGSRAAACCLKLDRRDLAVELLEQGRGVLLGQALDVRTDLTELRALRPELATRFADLRDRLAAAETTPEHKSQPLGPSASESEAARASRAAEARRRIDGEFEAVIAEARGLPNMERFLLPPRISDLLPTEEHEIIAMITVDADQSHALLLTSAGIQVVPLPGLSPAAVQSHTLEFMSALNQTLAAETGDDAAEARLTAVLGWLWDVLASPVLNSREITGQPGDGQPWPRIWWCPSGLLSFLPLHAAGYHGGRFAGRRDTVLDRVVSSYTATVRALVYSRRPVTPTAVPAGQVLVVAMEQTPDADDLPAATEEAALLAEKFGRQAKILNDANEAALATPGSVLNAMPDYPWAHFACHADVNLRDPSASHLLLHDRDVLTVLDINRLRLEGADLAYLSACSTAMTGGTLPDEAINLASAFQLAGYRRVIATLWPVDDDVAASLAHSFYDNLGAAKTAATAALALHHAVRLSRDRYPKKPSMWAAHVHSGI